MEHVTDSSLFISPEIFSVNGVRLDLKVYYLVLITTEYEIIPIQEDLRLDQLLIRRYYK